MLTVFCFISCQELLFSTDDSRYTNVLTVSKLYLSIVKFCLLVWRQWYLLGFIYVQVHLFCSSNKVCCCLICARQRVTLYIICVTYYLDTVRNFYLYNRFFKFLFVREPFWKFIRPFNRNKHPLIKYIINTLCDQHSKLIWSLRYMCIFLYIHTSCNLLKWLWLILSYSDKFWWIQILNTMFSGYSCKHWNKQRVWFSV